MCRTEGVRTEQRCGWLGVKSRSQLECVVGVKEKVVLHLVLYFIYQTSLIGSWMLVRKKSCAIANKVHGEKFT